MSKWISVKQCAPEKNGRYAVKCNDIITEWEDVAHAYICPEYGNLIWTDDEDEDFYAIVTHWKPLPEDMG